MGVVRVSCCCHIFLTPTALCVPLQITCGSCICRVQKVLNVSTILSLSLATLCSTLKDMGVPAINMVNERSWLEKSINWCVPLFC
jgi:hypothetical protein